MIFRHPHVFGNAVIETQEQENVSWEAVKMAEKNQTTVTQTLQSVSRSLPGLWRGEKILKKAENAGIKWPECSGEEALLKGAISGMTISDGAPAEGLPGGSAKPEGKPAEEIIGDMLLAVVARARALEVDPEAAIGKACDRFIDNFKKTEDKLLEEGRDLKEVPCEELTKIYREVEKQ